MPPHESSSTARRLDKSAIANRRGLEMVHVLPCCVFSIHTTQTYRLYDSSPRFVCMGARLKKGSPNSHTHSRECERTMKKCVFQMNSPLGRTGIRNTYSSKRSFTATGSLCCMLRLHRFPPPLQTFQTLPIEWNRTVHQSLRKPRINTWLTFPCPLQTSRKALC